MNSTIQTNGSKWARGLTGKMSWELIGALSQQGRAKLEAEELAKAHGRCIAAHRRVLASLELAGVEG